MISLTHDNRSNLAIMFIQILPALLISKGGTLTLLHHFTPAPLSASEGHLKVHIYRHHFRGVSWLSGPVLKGSITNSGLSHLSNRVSAALSNALSILRSLHKASTGACSTQACSDLWTRGGVGQWRTRDVRPMTGG